MSTTREERLCKVFDYLVFSGDIKTRQDFAEAIGTNKTNLSSAMNGNEKYLSDGLLMKIHSAYNKISLQWLLRGEGEMLNPQAATMTSAEEIEPIPDQQEAMARAMNDGHRVYADARNIGLSIEDAEIVGEHSPLQRGDTRPLTNEDCRDCPEKIPFVRREFVQARDVNIQELVKKEPHRIEFRSMRDFIGFPDYAQKVITEAMVPDFLPGDVLFIQYLSDNAKVMSGAIYLVDTKLYGAMVRQVFVDEGHFVLHSKNPDYKELKLRKDDVYSFALVLHSLRSNFRISSDMPAGASVFKKREEQLERLLDMNAEAMAEIRLQNERLAEERRRQDEERASERIRHDKLIERILKLDN